MRPVATFKKLPMPPCKKFLLLQIYGEIQKSCTSTTPIILGVIAPHEGSPLKILSDLKDVSFNLRTLTKFQVYVSICSEVTRVMPGVGNAGLIDHPVCTLL